MTWQKKGAKSRVGQDDSDSFGGKSMKLGGGGRFSKLESEVAQEPGVRNPQALAASIGRKKYGKSKFAAMSKKG